jgi:hypothetical protein
MNQARCLILHGSTLVASFQLQWEPTPHEVVCEEMGLPARLGYSFFCSECYEVWGRILLEGESSKVLMRHCLKHRGWDNRPDVWAGSLCLPTEPIYSAMPPEFWHHELRVLAQADEYWC